jgi:tyrosinase
MTYPITGIRACWGPNNAVPARREIDEWYTSSDRQDNDQVNLYIQALINFQNIPADEKLSFFQVAGKQ